MYHALSLKITDKGLTKDTKTPAPNTSCKHHAQAHRADVACNTEAPSPVAVLQGLVCPRNLGVNPCIKWVIVFAVTVWDTEYLNCYDYLVTSSRCSHANIVSGIPGL